jgi:hypothetical protein
VTDVSPEVARPVLDLPMPDGNDAGAATIREYLIQLLTVLWRENEGFSGKRPFGNSGWDYDLYGPLIEAGLISGRLDEDGFIEDVDDKAGDRLIFAAIVELGRVDR